MSDIQKYLKAVSDLEDRCIDQPMDNLQLGGIHLSFCSDGSGSLIFHWEDIAIERPPQSISDLLRMVGGAGQTEIEFHSIAELETVLIDKGVLDG